MSDTPGFDTERAHKHFAVYCFNAAWEFIRRTDRTPEEDLEMIRLAQASMWHWMQHPDCTDKNLSIGYWQLSRVHALVGDAKAARTFGQLCLAKSVEPFYLGYAHEALARAEAAAGNDRKVQEHLAEGRRCADSVTNDEHRAWLVKDLDTVRKSGVV